MNEITLAICVYNGSKYIQETLSCIVNQTYQDFDLLIINDCSTDDTKNRIKKFFDNNPRSYRLVNFQNNVGLAAGRRYVENNVKTKYITFIDSDDCPYPQYLEKLYDKISNDDDLMVVGCYLEFIDSEGRNISGGQYLGDTTKSQFYNRARRNKLIFLASNAIFNRELANSVGGREIKGFFEGKPRFQDLCEDLDLWTRMSDLYTDNKAIVVLPEVLLKYRKHDQGLSSSSFNMILRMRHVKTNLLRRRAGGKDCTFVEFYNSLTQAEKDKLRHQSKAADAVRNGVFFLKKREVFSGIKCLVQAIWMDPKYFWQKVKSNSGLLK